MKEMLVVLIVSVVLLFSGGCSTSKTPDSALTPPSQQPHPSLTEPGTVNPHMPPQMPPQMPPHRPKGDPAMTDPHHSSATPEMPAGHPSLKPSGSAEKPPRAGEMKKTADGDIAEIYAKGKTLAGKRISVRGKVMKFTAQIMGKNWIHIQDGSGDPAAGTNDLTVTSRLTVKAGDRILATGTLASDKDIGAGYVYKVLLQDAEIKVEK